MARQNFMGPNGTTSDFLKVLLALKSNVMRDLHVASLAKVTEVNETYASVKPLPLVENETEKIVDCFFLEGLTLSVGDVVVVIYTDRNFIKTLKQLKLGQQPSPISKSSELHSEKYGIIIGPILSVNQNDP